MGGVGRHLSVARHRHCVGLCCTIVTTAGGEGVIIRAGGVTNVVTRGGGLVLNVNVKGGDRIKTNQVVATVAQPVLADKIKAMQESLAEAIREREHELEVRVNSAKTASRSDQASARQYGPSD